MQLRCYSCNMPFNIKRDEVEAALDYLHTEGLSHYNAHCPRCRKANRVSKEQLLKAAPNWVAPEDREGEAEES